MVFPFVYHFYFSLLVVLVYTYIVFNELLVVNISVFVKVSVKLVYKHVQFNKFIAVKLVQSYL